MRGVIGSGLLGIGLALSGCQVTGGGWMQSKYNANEKATFGFVATCDFATDAGDEGDAGPFGDAGGLTLVSGEFQYKDHVPVPGDAGAIAPGTIVQLHGRVQTAVAFPADDGGDFGADSGDFGGDDGGFSLCGLRPDDGGYVGIDDGLDDTGPFVGFFAGTYEPQPKKIRGVPRATGTFNAYWEDKGEPPGLSDGDELFIELFGGVFGGYYHGGTLGGGNIDFEFLEPTTAN